MRGRKAQIAVGVVAIVVIGLGIWVGPVIRDVIRAGFLESVSVEKYRAGREENLRAIHTALTLYHDSEGAYPPADRWMDAIENRLRINKMTAEEALAKLRTPGAKGDAFGYALATTAAEKYRDDIPGDPKLLVLEAPNAPRNHAVDGRPSAERWAITVDGKILPAPPADESR
ncbi:MAG: hypothetical protein SFX74_07380 [Fimbriimonadaceae bacterium]|nr:hypothetical protein [Fimbriimonadaceae bacterium]